MTSLATVVAGSAEASTTAANNVPNAGDQLGSVCTAKATATVPLSVFSRDLPSLCHDNTPPAKHSRIPLPYPRGAESACATTRDMKRWTAPLENSVATVADAVTSISCVLISVPRLTTSSHMEKARRGTLNFMVMEKVEVELTSIQKGG